ncbi:hypothetical protein CHU98_g1035 [Xylaria longipes]|nr:hypothetical protein CHU98_g1035 [Xylaria longipes]
MRLIDVQTLKLKEFFHGLPPYAILSHTWGGEEVTFQEYLAATGPDPKCHAHIMQKAGFSKIVGACKRAKADGLQYLWCDTNCIDKSSSAELSEAINSMYAWYRDSVVCYAYLADVDLGPIVRVGQGLSVNPGLFQDSRWFTRGWTLQELLAPKKVVFFDRRWRVFGDRKDLADHISRITRIHIGALHDRNTVPEYSIAQRMSWAAGRQTSRQEDVAYCLLGVFGIVMPLLYGEGNNAFIRLQHEVMKSSEDQSILAWHPLDAVAEPRTGILAQSPAYFWFCGSIVRDLDVARLPFTITNIGLSLRLPRFPTSLGGLMLVGLNCSYQLLGRYLRDKHRQMGRHIHRRFRVLIWLGSSGHNTFERVHIPNCAPLLDRSYMGSVHHSVADVAMLTITPSFNQNGDIKQTGHKYCDPLAAGFLICFGVGKIDHRTRMYDEVFPFGRITIAHLKEKKISSLSHQLVSDGKFSLLMSAVWNKQGSILKWLQTAFFDPNGQVFHKLSLQRELACLFRDSYSSNDTSGDDLCGQLQDIHQTVRVLAEKFAPKHETAIPPVVFEEEEPLRDLHNQALIVITVIFQEEQSFVSHLDVARQLGI